MNMEYSFVCITSENLRVCVCVREREREREIELHGCEVQLSVYYQQV